MRIFLRSPWQRLEPGFKDKYEQTASVHPETGPEQIHLVAREDTVEAIAETYHHLASPLRSRA